MPNAARHTLFILAPLVIVFALLPGVIKGSPFGIEAHFVDLADPFLASWRGLIAGRRVLSTTLRSDPACGARTIVHSPLAVTARLDDCTTLTTTLADDTLFEAPTR